MTLIEVLIASVITAFIAIGTFTAFDAAGKSSADDRAHAQGTLLAQQDQERLRSFTTTTLEQMGTVETYRAENGLCLEKSGSTYTYFNGAKNTLYCEKVTGFAGTTYKGTPFTVSSSAAYVSAEKGGEKAALTCEKSGGTANYLQTKSSVTWPLLKKRTAISQTSVLNVPSSYVLEVKVINQLKEPVEGATVTVTGAPSTITPASGCVTFGGLASETVEVTATKGSWVDYNGKSPTTKSGLKLSTSSVVEETLHLAEPGSIVGEFESNGVATGIEAPSWFVFENNMSSPNDYVASSGAPEAKITLSKAFPFVQKVSPLEYENYQAYAGECTANNPETAAEAAEKLKPKPVAVTPGGSSSVKIEAPAVNVTVSEGTKATPESLLKTENAYIINKECEKGTAQNVVGTVTYKHKVALNSEGHLENKYKYQPFAKELRLCAAEGPKGGKYYRNYFKIANQKKAGTTAYKFYVKEVASSEDTGKEESASKLECP